MRSLWCQRHWVSSGSASAICHVGPKFELDALPLPAFACPLGTVPFGKSRPRHSTTGSEADNPGIREAEEWTFLCLSSTTLKFFEKVTDLLSEEAGVLMHSGTMCMRVSANRASEEIFGRRCLHSHFPSRDRLHKAFPGCVTPVGSACVQKRKKFPRPPPASFRVLVVRDEEPLFHLA